MLMYSIGDITTQNITHTQTTEVKQLQQNIVTSRETHNKVLSPHFIKEEENIFKEVPKTQKLGCGETYCQVSKVANQSKSIIFFGPRSSRRAKDMLR
jgi:hypothetical protein